MMYGHQVIEDLLKTYNRYAGQEISEPLASYLSNLRRIAQLIYQSQHFYLGNANRLYELFGLHYENKPLFRNEAAQDIGLPYSKCFFEFDVDDSGIESKPDQLKTTRTCILIWEQAKNLWLCFIINYFNEYKFWGPSDYYFWISIDKPLKDHDKIKEMFKINKIDPENISELYGANIGPAPMMPIPGGEFNPRIIVENERGDLSILNISLMLLSCKNITSQKNPAPEALNKARRKKGRTELFTYHTLKLIPFGKNKAYTSSGEEAESHYRIHLCRGHFKRFTEERPLFGRFTGLYWWQPQVRGKDKSGVVMKDYEMSVN